jgi:hypothetical protein
LPFEWLWVDDGADISWCGARPPVFRLTVVG